MLIEKQNISITGKNSIKTDVVIVGAGIAGMSLAYQLALIGRNAILVDAEDSVPYHSTARSAALFSESYASTVEFAQLSTASKQFLFNPPQGFTEAKLVDPRDTLYLAGRPEPCEVCVKSTCDQTCAQCQVAELKEYKMWGEQHASMAPFPAKVSMVGRAKILEAVPILKKTFPLAGSLELGSGDLDVHAIWSGYERVVRANGIKVFTKTKVLSAQRLSKGWRLTTSSGEISANVIVNASGAWGDEMAKSAGQPLTGLQPKLRTALEVSLAPDQEIPEGMPFVFLTRGGLYFRISNGKLLASAADEVECDPIDAFSDELTVAEIIYAFETISDVKTTGRPRAWAGLRSFTPDLNPVVGYTDEREDFFQLIGQGGYGIQTCPALSELACNLLCKGKSSFPNQVPREISGAFDPKRFVKVSACQV